MATTVPAGEFKRRLSEFLGRVLFRKERLVITRRGKPVAQVCPPDEGHAHIGQTRGWLEDSDSFFSIMDRIVSDRAKHTPRAWRAP